MERTKEINETTVEQAIYNCWDKELIITPEVDRKVELKTELSKFDKHQLVDFIIASQRKGLFKGVIHP